MSLAEDLAVEVSHGRSGPKCQVCKALNSMSDEDEAALVAALADPGYTAAGIGRVLRRRGVNVSDRSLQRYRTEEHDCGTR